MKRLLLTVASTLLSSICFATPNTMQSEALQGAVKNAIMKFERTNRLDWAYTVNRYENEEGDVSESVEAFDGSLPYAERWQLLSVNTKTPTADQVHDYQRRKAEQEDSAQHISIELAELIQIPTLTLISDNNGEVTAGFDVYLSRLGDEASASLRGQLILNEELSFIRRIAITNTTTFSPVFSAKIEDFTLTIDFIAINQAILPKAQSLEMKGSFAFFTEINETSQDTFSQYRRVSSGQVDALEEN